MKQILQSLKNGNIEIVDIPVPAADPGCLTIKTTTTLVSSGTERMLVAFGKANILEKAMSQPERVSQVVDKIKSDGIFPTLRTVANKLDQPIALGNSNVGIVVEVGEKVEGYKIGDRVVSNGKHSEYTVVPSNLCVKVPSNIQNDEAVFGVIGAIALQGIRLVSPTIGETIVVIGLGLIGLITVKILRANGCRVIGIDYDEKRVKLASQFGAEAINLSLLENPSTQVNSMTNGVGADAVIIAASTSDDEPIRQASEMSRKRGRIVLVGTAEIKISRTIFYEKELTFQVSSSYGPGRYDHLYEKNGIDYPIGYIRWTAQRNIEAILNLISHAQISLLDLITHRVDISNGAKAYELLMHDKSALAILIDFNLSENILRDIPLKESKIINKDANAPDLSIGLIGAGSYATNTILPTLKSLGVTIRKVVSKFGVSGVLAAKKYGILYASTLPDSILGDQEISKIIVSTQHDTHAEYVLEAIRQNKEVYVEKPLCLTLSELSLIEDLYLKKENEGAKPFLMVGFNRRFAPQVLKIKELIGSMKSKKIMIMTINAGSIPKSHWTRDSALGGGRIIGEVCHFIDLLRYLIGHKIQSWAAKALDGSESDTVAITIMFVDGSIGLINYITCGNRSYPKERLEIFTDAKVLVLENYKKLHGYGWKNFKKNNLWVQDKGQRNCFKEFLRHKKGSGALRTMPADEIFEVSKIAIQISESIK